MSLYGLLRSLKRWDDNRNSMPGEHMLVFGLGTRLLLSGGRGTLLRRAVRFGAGAALVARALSGRDGAVQVLRRAPQASRDSGATAHVAGAGQG